MTKRAACMKDIWLHPSPRWSWWQGSSFQPANFFWLLLLIVSTSFAFIGMMFLMMVRVNDPLIPRAIFGILNTLLYFPSGAIYPIQAFPKWLQAIAWVDPFSYSVH